MRRALLLPLLLISIVVLFTGGARPALGQQNGPLLGGRDLRAGQRVPGEVLDEIRPIAIRIREEVEAAAAAIAVEELARFNTEEKRVEAERQKLDVALKRYRALILWYADLWLRDLNPVDAAFALRDNLELVRGAERGAYTEAVRLYEPLLADAADHDARSALRGRAWARLLAARCEVGALEDLASRVDPVIGRLNDMGRLEGPRTSSAVVYQERLLNEILTIHPSRPVVPDGGDRDFRTWLRLKQLDALIEEFRFIAMTATMVDPATGRQLSASSRAIVGGQAIEYLAWRLERLDSREEFANLINWGRTRGDLGAEIQRYATQWSDYEIAKLAGPLLHEEHGSYFAAVAAFIRREQTRVNTWYRDEYLAGDGRLSWNLDQVFRVGFGADTGTAGSSDEAVRARIDRFMIDTDAAALAFEAAANAESPADLSSDQRTLLKMYGFVAIDPEGEYRFVTAEDNRRLHAHIAELNAVLDLPGATWMSVLSPKSVAIAAISVIVPELASARLVAAMSRAGFGARATLLGKLAADTVAGVLTDAAIEYAERGRVDAGRLVRESLVLGLGLQGLGPLSDGAARSLMQRIAGDPGVEEVARTLGRDLAAREAVQQAVGELLGLASETAATAAYQALADDAEIDVNAVLTIAVQGALSRTVAAEFDQRRVSREEFMRLVPDRLRARLESNPYLGNRLFELVAASSQRLAEAKRKYTALADSTGAVKPETVFQACLRGEITWNEVRLLYAADPVGMRGSMIQLKNLRDAHFRKFVRDAQDAALVAARNEWEWAVLEARARGESSEAVAALNARYIEEIDLITRELVTPGSGDPTSDIDRSAASELMRLQLRAIYRRGGGDGVAAELPSLISFDVNEYIAVFPQITANAKYVTDMAGLVAGDGYASLSHREAMEALSLAGAMQHMTEAQRDAFEAGRIASLAERAIVEGGDGGGVQNAVARLREKFGVARASLKASEDRMAAAVRRESARRGLPEDHPAVQVEARDAVYSERMKQFNDDVFRLQSMGADAQRTPEALALRARIEREMSVAMRDGIETYSSPVGLDIVVNRVQAAEKTLPDGTKVKMTVADRMMDPEFVVGKGDLAQYTRAEAEAVLNDQLMFITEHINGFVTGHETCYEAGRALGKYIERAFLAMKMQGMDITMLRARPAQDPQRRLFEFASALVQNKGKPKELLAVLEQYAVRSPPTPETGLVELCRLVEEALPGMRGVTGYEGIGVARDAVTGSVIDSAGDAPGIYRRMRMTVQRRRDSEQAILEQAFGPEAVIAAIEEERRLMLAQIALAEQEIALLLQEDRQLPADAETVARLRAAYRARSQVVANLMAQAAPPARTIVAEADQYRQRLEQAERPRGERPLGVAAGANPALARRIDRRDHLRWLISELDREQAAAADRLEQWRRAQGVDLAGDWSAGLTEPIRITLAPAEATSASGDSTPALWRAVLTLGGVSTPAPHATAVLGRRGPNLEGVYTLAPAVLTGAASGGNPANARGGADRSGLLDLRYDPASDTLTFSDRPVDPRLTFVHPAAASWAGVVLRRSASADTPAADPVVVRRTALSGGDPIPQPPSLEGLRAREGRGLIGAIDARGPSGALLTGGWNVYRAGGLDWVAYSDSPYRIDVPPGVYDLHHDEVPGLIVRDVTVVAGQVVLAQGPRLGRLTVGSVDVDGRPRSLGSVVVRSAATGERIRADALVPGAYAVECASSVGRTVTITAEVGAGELTEVMLRLGRIDVRTTLVDSEASGVSIRLRALDTGASSMTILQPGAALDLPPGRYGLESASGGTSAMGWFDHGEVAIGPGESMRLDATWARLDFENLANHAVSIRTATAAGPGLGLSPGSTSVHLCPGTYEVTFVDQAGGARRTERVTLAPGQRMTLRP